MICIGDVHGCLKTLKALIAKLPKGEQIVFTGDLIDRGPKSKQVVQFVMDKGYLCVLGNHEDMMLYDHQNWGYNGGTQTADSYKLKYSVRFSTPLHIDPYEDTSDKNYSKFTEHQKWMQSLPLYLLFDDVVNEEGDKLLVTHSSAAKVWKWSEEHRKQQEFHFRNHIIWTRDYNPQKIPGVFNVIGHTPVKEPAINKERGVAFIDTGAVFKEKLTALQYPSMQVFQQEFID